MKTTMQPVFFILILVMFFLSACSQASTPVTDISTLLPTSTVIPANTSTTTPTPSPTRTPVPPTATIPAPNKVLEYLNDVQVVSIDTFDKQLSIYNWHFNLDDGVRTTNGVLEIPGKDWIGVVARRKFNEGQGAILDFTYTKGAAFEVYVSHDLPDSDGYKAFCVYFEKNLGKTNVWAAKHSLGGETIPGDLVLHPDTNYSLVLSVIPDGEFLMMIWEPSNPIKTKYYHEKIGKNWSDLTWDFGIAAKTGTVLVDNYQEIKFDSIK